MANIGLDGFLGKEDKRLVDLDWLDVKEGEYENLPFDPIPHYIAEPKLVQEWSHEEDNSNLNLVPNSEFNFNYNMPSRMSKDIEGDVAELLKYTAKEMMSGKTGSELVKVIKDKSTPLIIKAAQEHLTELAKEQGLLGGVYVDPTIFKSCYEGSKFVAKRAKTAKFVKAMSACSSCVHNSCGRCHVYKKRISSEINYDKELFNFYSKHISSLLGKTIEIKSKDDLQRAFTSKREEKPRIAEYKPKISKSKEEEKKTLEKTKEDFESQVNNLKEELGKVFEGKVAKDISSLLIKKYSAKVIKDHISKKYSSEERASSKDIFNYILSKQGSLGRVFVEAEMLPQDLSLDGIPNIKFIILKPNSPVEQNPGFGKFKNRCRGLHKKIVPSIMDIPKEAFQSEFDKYPVEITDKIASIFKKDSIQGLRLAFLQYELTNRESSAPIITENFDLQAKLDPTEYTPKVSTEVTLTPKKIVQALVNGYSLSSIIKTGRKLGVADESIKVNLKKAFEEVTSLHKRQLDIPVNLPESVEVKISQKDISFELNKPVSAHEAHEINFNSSEAPVDTLVKDLELKDSNLDLKDIDKKSSDIEISGMNEFTIDL